MNTKVLALPAISCLAIVAGSMLTSGPAFGQAQAKAPEEIIVEAPRLIRERSSLSGGKTDLISLTRHVNYADLDLTKHKDVMTLEQRIKDTAKEACSALAKMYPHADASNPDCMRQAVKRAMDQANSVVAAAENR